MNTSIYKCFKKIKVTEKPNKELNKLFEERKVIKSKESLEKIQEKLAEMFAEKKRKIIMDEISGIECTEGGTHSGKLWQLRKKLFPKSRCDARSGW